MKNFLKAVLAIFVLNIFYLDRGLNIGGVVLLNQTNLWSYALIVLSIVFLIFIYKDRDTLSNFRKKYLKWLLIFLGIMVIELIYRLFKYEATFEMAKNFRFVLSHLLIILVFTKDMINKKIVDYVMLGLLLFLSLYQLVYLFKNDTIRSSPLLGNVNLYLAVLMIIIPYILFALKRNMDNKYYSILTYIAILLTYFLLPFSGSRSGFYIVLASLTFTLLLFIKYISKKQIVILISMLVIGLAGAFSMSYVTRNPLQLGSISRATTIDLTWRINQSKIDKYDRSGILEDVGGSRSDSVRSGLWKSSIENVKSDPIFGSGKLLTKAYIGDRRILDQYPHNFILEYIIAFGLIGAPVYMYLLYSSVIEDIKYKIKNKKRIFDPKILCFTSQIIFLSVFSFFQPAMRYELVVQTLILSLIGLFYNTIYFDKYDD